MELVRRAWRIFASEGLLSLFVAARRSVGGTPRQSSRQFRALTNLRHRIQQLRYVAPADPYKLIRLDPREITYTNSKFVRQWGFGQIRGGEWDLPRHRRDLEDNWVVVGLRQRFEEGRDWKDTVYYERARQQFIEGNSKWNYEDIDQFIEVRCAYVDDLYRLIRDEGYRPNVEAYHDVPRQDVRSEEYDQRFEPLVVIGRDGDVLLADGRHRVAIARILGLESVPVNVLGRHRKWQQVRDAFARARTRSDVDSKLRSYFGHPDVADLRLG
jgi:hypothetical protein